MTTFSLDTNVLIALWDDADTLNLPARQCLDHARAVGRMRLSAPVYCELMGHPSRSIGEIDSFLAATGIDIDWSLEEAVWRAAGAAFQGYVRRRVASNGTLPRRILTDFLIGAHAAVRGYTLVTLDQKLYGVAFPGLRTASF
jgi:predicted nucleic acid-binding protein